MGHSGLDHPTAEVQRHQVAAIMAVRRSSANERLSRSQANIADRVLAIDSYPGRAGAALDRFIEDAAAGQESCLLLGAVRQLFLDLKRAPLREAVSRLHHCQRFL